MKRVLFFVLLLTLAANAFAGITVVKMTKVDNKSSYLNTYKATFYTSQTITTLDTLVFVDPLGNLFDLSGMADSLISVYTFLKTGSDSSHIKIEMAATYLPTARITTAYAGVEWKVMATKSDSDATNYYHDFVTTKNAGGNTQFAPYLVRFSIAEYNQLNEYIKPTLPATIYISWRKRSPVSR